MVLADYDVERARLVQSRLGEDRRTRRRPPAPRGLCRCREAELCPTARPRARRGHRRQRRRPALRADDLRRRIRRRSRLPRHGGQPLGAAPHRPLHVPGVKLGDYQFPKHETWKAAGRLAILGLGMDPGLTDLFAATPTSTSSTRSTSSTSATAAILHRGLCLRPGLQHLDHDRGVPQPAAHLGRRPGRPLHDRAVLRPRGLRLPGGDRPRGVRQRRARGGRPHPARHPGRQEGDLQVRPRRRLHQRPQGPPRGRPRSRRSRSR